MMKFNSQKFKQPYSVKREGRGNHTSFPQSFLWQQNIALKIWNCVKQTCCKFVSVWADPNTAKTHFAVTFGEALPFQGSCAILVHTQNLVEQHQETLDHYRTTGFTNKAWSVVTIQQMYSWIQKLNKGKEIDQEAELMLNSLEYINADECHRYAKGLEAVMFETVMNWLFNNGKMKLVVGTSGTARDINKLWEWAGASIDRAKYTFRPHPNDLQQDGLSQQPVTYLHVDSKTTTFNRHYTDSIGARIDDPSFDQYCDELLNTDPDHAYQNLIDNDHLGRFRTDPKFRIEQLKYQDNRVDVAIHHWLKKERSKPAIISVRGVNNAIWYEGTYKSLVKQYGYDVIAWNGETKRGQNANPIYKNDEKKMLADLRDPNHPLKVVLVNGMLREGTNEPIRVVYQCAFTAGGGETSVQVGNRGDYTVIMLDAMNIAKMPKSGWQQALADTLKEVGIDRTPQELIAAFQSQQARLNANNPSHKTPNVLDQIRQDWMDQEYDPEQDQTENGVEYTQIISKDVWVKDVVYQGNYHSKMLNKSNPHQTLQQALDILGEYDYA